MFTTLTSATKNLGRFFMGAKYIFLAWIFINALFGLLYIYMASHNPEHGLLYNGKLVTNVWDGIYFSFIASATVGFGDIVPIGFSKIVSVIQSLIGLVVLTLLISEIIHGEEKDLIKKIHGYSSSDRVKRVQSGFYFFRENIEQIIAKFYKKQRGTGQTLNYLSLQFLSLTTLLEEVADIHKTRPMEARIDIEEGKLIMHMILSLQTLRNAIKFLSKKHLRFSKVVKEELKNAIILAGDVTESLGEELTDANKKNLIVLLNSLKKYS